VDAEAKRIGVDFATYCFVDEESLKGIETMRDWVKEKAYRSTFPIRPWKKEGYKPSVVIVRSEDQTIQAGLVQVEPRVVYQKTPSPGNYLFLGTHHFLFSS
jgi:hypothetical protein